MNAKECQRVAETFLNLPGERLVASGGQHWITIIPSIIALILSYLFLVGVGIAVNSYITHTTELLISHILVTTSLGLLLLNKIIIDWHFHLYIVTTRKIMEIAHSPLFWQNIDDVFLDQVRTTEVDFTVSGLLSHIFNTGDVIISFDRPSHDRSFTLRNIYNPREVSTCIARELEVTMESSPVWFKKTPSPNQVVQVGEDVLPEKSRQEERYVHY